MTGEITLAGKVFQLLVTEMEDFVQALSKISKKLFYVLRIT
jgi:hypothetical protein